MKLYKEYSLTRKYMMSVILSSYTEQHIESCRAWAEDCMKKRKIAPQTLKEMEDILGFMSEYLLEEQRAVRALPHLQDSTRNTWPLQRFRRPFKADVQVMPYTPTTNDARVYRYFMMRVILSSYTESHIESCRQWTENSLKNKTLAPVYYKTITHLIELTESHILEERLDNEESKSPLPHLKATKKERGRCGVKLDVVR